MRTWFVVEANRQIQRLPLSY